jgi:hypothetical protein
MIHVTTRTMTPEERERLLPALQHDLLAKKGLMRWLFGGRRVAARLATTESTVSVVSVEALGARALMKANARPGDLPAWLLALENDRLLVVASQALPTACDPQLKSAFPHKTMTWSIGPAGALLDYTAGGPQLKQGRPAMVSAMADRTLHRSFELVDGHVFPGTLTTCVVDLERYVQALPSSPEKIPAPGDANALPDEACVDA